MHKKHEDFIRGIQDKKVLESLIIENSTLNAELFRLANLIKTSLFEENIDDDRSGLSTDTSRDLMFEPPDADLLSPSQELSIESLTSENASLQSEIRRLNILIRESIYS